VTAHQKRCRILSHQVIGDTAAIKQPKLDAYADQIDQWLVEDKGRPSKQQHTAKHIFLSGAVMNEDSIADAPSSPRQFRPSNHPTKQRLDHM
jgi:hypothetical protein